MKKLITILILGMLVSCGDSNTYKSNVDQTNDVKVEIPSDLTYEVIKEEPDAAYSKVNLKIRLNQFVDEGTLKAVALKLKSERPDYEKLWIFYYLPGHKTEGVCWATTHFMPKLEVDINGPSKEAFEEMKSRKVSGEIKNAWLDNNPMIPTMRYLVEENNKLYMKTIFANRGSSEGTIMIDELTKSGNRYDYENGHGEYYIIEKNGNLGLYGNNGKFKEAERKDND